MTKPMTDAQKKRQGERDGGQYAKYEPCQRCGKRVPTFPSDEFDYDAICQPCTKELSEQ